MEHVVQFGINLDDSAIERVVVEKATEEVKKGLMENIARNMPKNAWGVGVEWPRAAAEMLQGWFDENRDELMDMAATKLADKAFKSKAWKERMDMLVSVGVDMVGDAE